MYEKITKKTGRIFVVGDIHGEITQFQEKLDEINFDKKTDIMISVGDLIDRGEDSIACLELINEKWFHCVRGNHEQMAYDAITEQSDERIGHWMMNGGGWITQLDTEERLYAQRLIKKVINLPFVIEVDNDGKKIVICHADYPSDKYEFDKVISCEASIWDRQRYTDSRANYQSVITGADLFVFGHTPVNKPVRYENQLYIDTGAVFGKQLTVIEL